MLSLAGCGQAAGTIIDATDRPIFVTFGVDVPRLYLAAGQRIDSSLYRPTGAVTIFSPGTVWVRCSKGEKSSRTDRCRVVVLPTGHAMTCLFY